MNGKLPPQTIELEEAVLGAVMLEKSALVENISSLIPHYFYKDSHQMICQSIVDLYAEGSPVDILTVTARLRKKNELEKAGGAFAVTELTESVSSGSNTAYHLTLIKEKYLLREMISLGSDLQQKGYDNSTDCFELIDHAQVSLMNVVQGFVRKGLIPIKSSVTSVIEDMAQNMAKNERNEMTGVTTGIQDIDSLTGGWQSGDLIILAARPAMGKTGLALTMARSAAKQNQKVLFCSLEMTHQQLTYRVIAQEFKQMDVTKMQRGEINQDEFNSLCLKADELHNFSLTYDDDAGLNIIQLRAKANQMKAQSGIDLIVVDYLQLMSDSTKESNREQEISRISRGLKVLAKDLEVPVIALSQLSRAVETRGGGHKPKLSDLRESGAIEQDADMVIFLYRPEYYGIKEYETDEEIIPTKAFAVADIAKHRNGPTGEVYMKFDHKFTSFDNWKTPLPQPDYKFPETTHHDF